MCNCYGHKCKKCNRIIPIHLGDFNTGQDEIEVFCWNHLPKNNAIFYCVKNAQAWAKKEHLWSYKRERKFIGKTIAIRSLTKNAVDNKLYNHPNLILEYNISEVV